MTNKIIKHFSVQDTVSYSNLVKKFLCSWEKNLYVPKFFNFWFQYHHLIWVHSFIDKCSIILMKHANIKIYIKLIEDKCFVATLQLRLRQRFICTYSVCCETLLQIRHSLINKMDNFSFSVKHYFQPFHFCNENSYWE